MAEQELAIHATNLVKRYGPVTAVDHVTLKVTSGEVFGLLGPNGAGKTTTLEILEGLRKPDQGDIWILGHPWGDMAVRERIGILLQGSQLMDNLTPLELITLYASFYRRPLDSSRLLHEVGLAERANVLVQRLSGGQKQRLALALALVGDPELVFLDEPTTGLDPQARQAVWDIIRGLRAAGKTIVLSTHYMEEAEALCDRVGIIDHGRIVAEGQPRQLIEDLRAPSAIECSVEPPFNPEDLRQLLDVSSVEQQGSLIVLYTSEVIPTVEGLLGLTRSRQRTLSELRIRTSTLEDVFLALTGRSLRD